MGRPKKVVENKQVAKPVEKEAKAEIKESANVVKMPEYIDKEVLTMAENAKRANMLMIERDSLKKSLEEVKKNLEDLKKDYSVACMDYNNKTQAIQILNSEFRAKANDLQNIKETISKSQQREYENLQRKIKEVEEADLTYKKLVQENTEINKKIKNDYEAGKQRAKDVEESLGKMQRQMDKQNGEMKAYMHDLELERTDFKKEKDEFEEYKDTLQPTLDKISAIKNENIVLLQKIERQEEVIKSKSATAEHKRQTEENEIKKEWDNIKVALQTLDTKEKQLNELQLKYDDKVLELRAQEIDFEQKVKRHNLEKKVKSSNTKG